MKTWLFFMYDKHMTEDALYEQLAQYLNLKYPLIIYHFDPSGVWTPSFKARNLYGKLNSRAFPDLFIAQPAHGYAGLFIELKKEGTVIYKKDGSLRASTHVAEQMAMLKSLEERGYKALMCVGFTTTQSVIDSYLN